MIDLAVTIAATRSSVLIVGEPGTGKSLLAQLIHSLGEFARSPVRHRRGLDDGRRTFDASSRASFAPDSATNHTLDWSNKMARPPAARSSSTKSPRCPWSSSSTCCATCNFETTRRAPGTSPQHGEARLIMSTSENLTSLIDQGRFRQELYHRISVISLMLPPLRHRGTDVELLAESFRNHYAREFHKSVAGFTRDALEVLQKHDWPGNVRELAAAIQRAVAFATARESPPTIWRRSSTTTASPAPAGGATPVRT